MMRKSITATFLLCVSLFLCVSAYAQTSNSTAVVSFVGYGDEDYRFAEAPKKLKRIFTSQDGPFKVSQGNYLSIDLNASFPSGFASKISDAVAKISGKDSPLLILAIESHGDPGLLGREKEPFIKYEDLFSTLIKNSAEAHPEMQIMIFLSTCYSGSAIPALKDLASKYKVTMYTLADAEHEGLGAPFFSALEYLGKIPKYRSPGVGLTPEGYYLLNELVEGTNKAFPFGASLAATGYWSSFDQSKDKVLSMSAEEIEKNVADFAFYLLKSDDSSIGYFLNTTTAVNKKYTDMFIDIIKKQNNITDNKDVFKVIYKYYLNAKNKFYWQKLLVDHYFQNMRKIDRYFLEPHLYDFVDFGYEEAALASVFIENNDLSTMDLPYVARPKDIDLAISVTSDKSTKWGWISIQEYKNIKVKQLKFLISSIEKTTDEVMLQKLIKALLEFDSYNVTTYFDWHAYSAGIETLVNFDKQAVDVLKLVTSKNGLSDDIKEYARKGLLQLSEKVDPSAMLGKTAVDLDTLKTDGRNVVLRFMNETYETNDNVIQSMFFNKVYKEADLLNGKLSPYTLSVLFRDDVLSYIGQTSNPELSILAGITKDMIELERTNSDIKGFKNAKIEEFKEKYEEIKGLVKK